MALVKNVYLQQIISIHLIVKNNNFCSTYFIKLDFTNLFVIFYKLDFSVSSFEPQFLYNTQAIEYTFQINLFFILIFSAEFLKRPIFC